jgi:hypothetical protein
VPQETTLMQLDLTIPGAREEGAKLESFQRHLNREYIAPARGYRMSVGVYSLVCYVNNTVGLYLSGNYEVVPIFIARAHQYMSEHPATPQTAAYYQLVNRYLRQFTFVLKRFTSVTPESLEFIPSELLEAGPQDVPVDAPET